MKKKVSTYLYIVVFAICVFVLGGLSAGKLVRFYTLGETDDIEWIPQLGSKFETDVATNVFGKFNFINLNGAVRKYIGQRSMNGVVKLNNGYLLTTMPYCSDESLDKYTENVVKFNSYLEKRGTSLLYASTPYTAGKYDAKLPIGVYDYGNDNIDRFIDKLQSAGIDTIDFRQAMKDDGLDHYGMMYKTDHHWTTEAGFYAYCKFEDYIVKRTGCVVDERISDINNYTVTKYPRWHLGSRGQRTGIFYAGVDDFDLILPKFDTLLMAPNGIMETDGKIGSVQELMINMEPLQDRNLASKHTYDFVLQGTLGHYRNLNSLNNVKILFITDSFGYAVNQYLATGFKETYYLYQSQTSSITPEFIEEYDPDVVIMMYYPQVIQEESQGYSFISF